MTHVSMTAHEFHTFFVSTPIIELFCCLCLQISGAKAWHINSDEPIAEDYNQVS